jgi:hypothetical protein
MTKPDRSAANEALLSGVIASLGPLARDGFATSHGV